MWYVVLHNIVEDCYRIKLSELMLFSFVLFGNVVLCLFRLINKTCKSVLIMCKGLSISRLDILMILLKGLLNTTPRVL